MNEELYNPDSDLTESSTIRTGQRSNEASVTQVASVAIVRKVANEASVARVNFVTINLV